MSQPQPAAAAFQSASSPGVSPRLRYRIHGVNVEFTCQLPSLLDPIGQVVGDFADTTAKTCQTPVSGRIRWFDQQEVLKHLSPTATRVSSENELVELYEQGERFWLIDDHWGLCEINILKSQFRSWILPTAIADPLQIVEQAVLWPVSQLLRPRGLCLIPSASIVRDGWGALLLSNFNIEPELYALVRAGWRIVGQNWTALREEAGRIIMLNMPGSLARATSRSPSVNQNAIAPGRVDLTAEFCGSACARAECNAVLVVATGRRPLPQISVISPTNALSVLRGAWPMPELHPHRRQGQIAARIAQRCGVFDIQLSRNPTDILALVEAAQHHRPPTPRVTVTIHKPSTRPQAA